MFCNILRVLPPMFKPDLLQDRFYVGGKTRSIAIQLVLQQCCKTSCKLFVAVPLVCGQWPRVNVTYDYTLESRQIFIEIEKSNTKKVILTKSGGSPLQIDYFAWRFNSWVKNVYVAANSTYMLKNRISSEFSNMANHSFTPFESQ